MEVAELTKGTNILQCLECGKCTAICPVSKYNKSFSPRRVASYLITGGTEAVLDDEVLWSCLTCGMCNVYCPSQINFSEFIMNLREQASALGKKGTPSHGGTFYSIMKMMASPGMKQNRNHWLDGSLKTGENGEYCYFVGCTPYFDQFFTDIGVQTLDISKNAIKILNAMGIEPVVMDNERCCGHDLLWTGDRKGFAQLAEYNVQLIKERGVKKIVTSCAECYRTFSVDMPKLIGPTGLQVYHIAEMIADDKTMKFNSGKAAKVTFHDPCRLGRLAGLYDQPRQALEKVPGLELVEMTRSRNTALCCGTSAWMNCDTTSKRIQKSRLSQARETGAAVMATSCPKCYIHLMCTQHDKSCKNEDKIEVKDLTVCIGEALSE